MTCLLLIDAACTCSDELIPPLSSRLVLAYETCQVCTATIMEFLSRTPLRISPCGSSTHSPTSDCVDLPSLCACLSFHRCAYSYPSSPTPLHWITSVHRRKTGEVRESCWSSSLRSSNELFSTCCSKMPRLVRPLL